MTKIDFSKIPQVRITYSRIVPAGEMIKVSSAVDAIEIFRLFWEPGTMDYFESFKMMLLNRNNLVLGIADISRGGIAGTVVDRKIITQYALLSHSSGVLVSHCHPSGNLNPSEEDWVITEQVYQCLKVFNIALLDHIIITSEGAYEMSDDPRFHKM